MKKILVAGLFLFSASVYAQTAVIGEGAVTAKIKIIVPEDGDDIANVQNQGGGGGGMMRMMAGDMEMVSTMLIKGDKIRTNTKTDFGTQTTIRDEGKKMTYMLMNMMGQKNAYYSNDDEMQKSLDSMRKASEANGGDTARQRRQSQGRTYDVAYTDQTKKIAGYDCKKAYLVSTNILGAKDSTEVWYTSALKMPFNPAGNNSRSGGGGRGMMRMGSSMSLPGLEKLEGLPMQFEMKLPQGRRMTYEVSKIELDKKVDDKEFEVPKGYELKPMSDLMNFRGGGQGGQRVEVRMGN